MNFSRRNSSAASKPLSVSFNKYRWRLREIKLPKLKELNEALIASDSCNNLNSNCYGRDISSRQ
jgi:hypothetical protein